MMLLFRVKTQLWTKACLHLLKDAASHIAIWLEQWAANTPLVQEVRDSLKHGKDCDFDILRSPAPDVSAPNYKVFRRLGDCRISYL